MLIRKLSSNTHDLNDLRSVIPTDDPVIFFSLREKRIGLPPSRPLTKIRKISKQESITSCNAPSS